MGPDRLRWALAQRDPEESQGGVRHRGLGQGPRGTVQTTPALSPVSQALLSWQCQQREHSSILQTTNSRRAPPSSQSHDTALNFRILQNVQTGQCAKPPGPASESQDRLPAVPPPTREDTSLGSGHQSSR